MRDHQTTTFDEPLGAPSTSPGPAWSLDAPLRPSLRDRHRSARLETIELHCAGEPLRIVRSAIEGVPDAPILDRRRWALEHADHLRRTLMHEPRGHRDMYGALLLPPHRPDADVAVLFMHNEGYSTMCGHGTIALATALVEEGMIEAAPPRVSIRFETPAGLVTAVADIIEAPAGTGALEVTGVRFTNVPSYLAARDLSIRPEGVELLGSARDVGTLSVDVAFGGAYYGIVRAGDLGLRVVPEQVDALTRAGAAITAVLRRDHAPTHPSDPDLGFVYGTIVVDDDPGTSPDGRSRDADLRNVTIFAEAQVDRSPCGTGTSALLAQRHARGWIDAGEDLVNAGITGEAFRGRVESEIALGPHPAVLTSVAGTAYVTGYGTYVVDDRDPLGTGFLLR